MSASVSAAPPRNGGAKKKMISHVKDQRPDISEELRKANEAFAKELSTLLGEGHRDKWVLYVGDRRMGLETKRRSLIDKFRQQLASGIALLIQIREYPAFESMRF